MSPGTYNEDGLVEQPAIQLFEELGWETVNATDEILGASAPVAAHPHPNPLPAGEGVRWGVMLKAGDSWRSAALCRSTIESGVSDYSNQCSD